MRTKLRGLLVLCGILVGGLLFAQEKTVTGNVTDSDGFPLSDVSVTSSSGEEVFTDLDGNYSISVNQGDTLTIESLGLDVVKVTVGAGNVYNAQLRSSGAIELEGAVVTALGITREKRALGYATQEVSGETLSAIPVANFADAMQGEIAGLEISGSGTMGGSSNMVIRGWKSITGNNQALVVIDGTPINNNTYNSTNQTTGRGGFDFGNAAADINPNDVESVNVLKGAAATALYGSRGSNGVIMITTKKGKRNKAIGVEIFNSVTVGVADKDTLPNYQKKYGAGYGPFYGADGESYFDDMFDINGDGVPDLTVPFGEDASYGAAFDPNLMVYHWNSLFPQLSTYRQAAPWVAGKHSPNSIWKPSITYTNSASFSGSNEDGAFRLSFTHFEQNGNLVNSRLLRNTLDFSGEYKLTKNLKANANITYTANSGRGRYGTGYDGDNPMQAFRQWWQTNVDIFDQRDAYMQTGENLSWNATSALNSTPLYTDNYYFMRYNNYETDSRNRYFGNAALTYDFNEWLSIMGRYTFDNYDEIREERVAVGSTNADGMAGAYSLLKQTISENNYDAILSINKDLTDRLNLDANVGWNLRVQTRNAFSGATSGGLIVPGLYTLANSVNPLGAANLGQVNWKYMVDGEYARAGLGFDKTYFIEGSVRSDRSSALPKENNRYTYWSGSGSIVFSEIGGLKNSSWLNFGKFRGNYAEVGNDTNPLGVFDIYQLNASFGSVSSATNPTSINNKDLRPERTKGWELGLEMSMFKNRVGFDVSYYDNKTYDLITNIVTTGSAGMLGAKANVGDVTNKGWEVSLKLIPIKTNDFRWDLTANWAKNTNEVTKLAGDSDYYALATFQGGMEFGAELGQPLGVLVGTDYEYDEATGERIVGANGYWKRATGKKTIGNVNPDWTGGLRNTFTYKNVSLSFLIDFQKGGNVWSLDTYYGYATGLYDFTAGLNDLGNPIRWDVSQGGGVILGGVKEDGTPNDIRADASWYANPWGYARAANKEHMYDASYIKLRNLTLSYQIPEKLIRNSFISKMTVSAIGRNLWIIHKNIPYSDPEAGLSAGNLSRGMQSGAHPTIREIGASLKIEF
ncbi:MAG: SusC/RagA family TonB-linked outer membrane protein [Moheibacter sp.]